MECKRPCCIHVALAAHRPFVCYVGPVWHVANQIFLTADPEASDSRRLDMYGKAQYGKAQTTFHFLSESVPKIVKFIKAVSCDWQSDSASEQQCH